MTETKKQLMVVDLETYRAGDKARRPDFVRLGGYRLNGVNRLTTSGDEIAQAVREHVRAGGVVSTHNGFAFDLAVLARWHRLDLTSLIDHAIDTDTLVRLDDPPPSGKDGVAIRPMGYHGLDQSCQRYGVPAKTDEASGLAKKYAHYAEVLGKAELIEQQMADPALTKRQLTALRAKLRTYEKVLADLSPDRRLAIASAAVKSILPNGKYDGYGCIPDDSPDFRAYLEGDLVASDGLTRRLGRMNAYARREMNVGLFTCQLQVNGFRVDVPELRRILAEQENRRQENIRTLNRLTGMPIKGATPVRSSEGNAAIRQFLVDAGIKESAIPKTESTGMMKTGREELGAFKELLRSKAKGRDISRIERVLDLVVAVSGERTVYQTLDNTRVGDRVHSTTKATQASGRWSVTDPGLTVLGKRGGRHVERKPLLAEDGHVLVPFDLDQVDARGVAAHSRDRNYLAIFQGEKPDLHGSVAMQVFGSLEFREMCKPLNHGMNYRMGMRKAVDHTGLPWDVVEKFYDQYFDSYPDVVRWQEEMTEKALAGMLLDNGFGRKLRCDPRFAYTQAPALVGQGCTRDIIAHGILRLPVEFWQYARVIVHDEIVFSLPRESWKEMSEVILDALQFDLEEATDGYTASCPITAGMSRPGLNWAQCYEKCGTCGSKTCEDLRHLDAELSLAA